MLFEAFFAGRRPRRPGGGSSGAPRRLRGGGTARPGVSGRDRPGAAVRPRAGGASSEDRGLRGAGTPDCGAEGPSRSSYSPVFGLSTH
ncbi:hypothetical protein GCM10010228_54000 [Streptomyces massasporeus]|nr:hypothetical protein GCM10010228_54000 [Streptomyces massasporeus]